jgi:hypothetical protein
MSGRVMAIRQSPVILRAAPSESPREALAPAILLVAESRLRRGILRLRLRMTRGASGLGERVYG